MSKLEAMQEAYNRGILPEDKKAAFEEAQRRGLVGATSPASAPIMPEVTSVAPPVVDTPPEAGMLSQGLDFASDLILGEKENYPELPGLIGTDSVHIADTSSGQLNIIKKQYPNAELDFDKFGNPLVITNESIGGLKPEQPWYINAPGASISDISMMGDLATEMAPTIAASVMSGPLGWIKGGLNVGATAGLGEGITQAKAQVAGAKEGFNIKDIAWASAFGAGGEISGRVVAKGLSALVGVFRRASGNPALPVNKIVDTKTGNLTKEAQGIADKHGITAKQLQQMVARDVKKTLDIDPSTLTPEQMLRTSELESIGGRPTKGFVTRDPNDMRFEFDVKRTEAGFPLEERQAFNNRMLTEAAEKLKTGIGAETDDAANLVAGLQSVDQELDDAVGILYKQAEDSIGASTKVSLSKTGAEIDDLMDDVKAGLIPEVDAWLNKAKRLGVEIDESGDLVGEITVKQAESLRKKANRLLAGKPEEVSRAMGKIKSGLDDDVLQHAGKDVFGEGRKLAAERFNTLHSKEPAKKIVKDLISGKIDPDKAFRKIVINGGARDVQAVKDALLKTSAKSQLGSWNELRANTVKHAIDEATKYGGPNMMGQQSWSGLNFRKALEQQIGKKNLKVLFSEEELADLYKISRVGENLTTLPPNVYNPGTASSGMNWVERIVSKVPGPISRLLVGVSTAGKTAMKKAEITKKVTKALEPGKSLPKQMARNKRSGLPQIGVFAGNVYSSSER